jgi:hypothetical protein
MKQQLTKYIFILTTIVAISCNRPQNAENNYKVEIVTFSLKDTTDFADFSKASNDLKEFLLQINGFEKRTLLKISNNKFQDILIWKDQNSLSIADSLFLIDPIAKKYTSFMDTTSINFYYPEIINEHKK